MSDKWQRDQDQPAQKKGKKTKFRKNAEGGQDNFSKKKDRIKKHNFKEKINEIRVIELEEIDE